MNIVDDFHNASSLSYKYIAQAKPLSSVFDSKHQKHLIIPSQYHITDKLQPVNLPELFGSSLKVLNASRRITLPV